MARTRAELKAGSRITDYISFAGGREMDSARASGKGAGANG
jgi:hypothetical protein